MIRIALAALALLLAPAAALAEHEAGLPEATCIVLPKIGDGAAAVTWQGDGDELVIPVVITCDNLDATDSEIHVERVDVTYEILENDDAVTPRPRRESVKGECSRGALSLDVTILGGAQKAKAPFRGISEPLKVEAHLSFRARKRTGPKKWCFGSMEWEFEVRPGSEGGTSARP